MKTLTLALALFVCSLPVLAQHCKATKKDGTPCKFPYALPSGYCPMHDSATQAAVPRCGFIKKDGTPCRMRVAKAGDRCIYHNSK